MRLISQNFLLAIAGITAVACCAGCWQHEAPPGMSTPNISTNSAAKQNREQILHLSAGAAEQLRSMRDRGNLKPSAIVRITVVEGNFHRFKNGGDKRYRYTLLLDDAPKNFEDDYVMESQGFTVHVAKPNSEFLRGAEVIWIESGGKGGFKFLNPNELADDDAAGQVINDLNSPQDSKSGDTPTLQ